MLQEDLTITASAATSFEMTSAPPDLAHLEARMLSLIAEHGPGKTLCPSDVARALVGSHPDNWGPLMLPIRKIAVRLAQEGRLVIYRKGKPADPEAFKGVYRLGAARED